MTLEEFRKLKGKHKKLEGDTLAKIQSKCHHDRIGHSDGFEGDTVLHPRRICLTCGLEEEGGWWCYSIDCSFWHSNDGNTSLGPREGRIFIKMSRDEVYAARP